MFIQTFPKNQEIKKKKHHHHETLEPGPIPRNLPTLGDDIIHFSSALPRWKLGTNSCSKELSLASTNPRAPSGQLQLLGWNGATERKSSPQIPFCGSKHDMSVKHVSNYILPKSKKNTQIEKDKVAACLPKASLFQLHHHHWPPFKIPGLPSPFCDPPTAHAVWERLCFFMDVTKNYQSMARPG